MDINKVVQKLCDDNHVELLYLTKSGSHLYGCNTENSDLDYKGIFLPELKNLIIEKKIDTISYSSGNDKQKNTQNDIDIELWSIQKWLKMINRGETGALDLLFSFTNTDTKCYMNEKINVFFENYSKLFNVLNSRAFMGYALSQANRYCIKGTRLNVLIAVYDFLKKYSNEECEKLKLSSIMNELVDTIKSSKSCAKGTAFCSIIETLGTNNTKILGLNLLGKIHQEIIFLKEFKERVYLEYSKYGKRASLSSLNDGKDFKAISHCVRVILQMKELLLTGKIVFPLKDRKTILDVKLNAISWEEIEDIISNGIQEVDDIINDMKENKFKDTYNENFVNEELLKLYMVNIK